MEIIDILREIGYTPSSEGNCYRMKAIYRGGNNKTSLVVFKRDGGFHDYVTGERGSLEELVSKTLNCSIDESLKFCHRDSTIFVKKIIEEAPVDNKVDPKEIDNLLPIYKFYHDKGISTETLNYFKGGFCASGKMSDRFVFPVYNDKNQLVGVSGRDVTNKKLAKWKKIGRSSEWNYPYSFLKEYIEESQEIILVESVGDMLNLFESGIRNVLCLCGKELSKEMLKTILKCNPKKIYISLNNDSVKKDGSRPGQDSSVKIKGSLSKFFNVINLEIKLPTKKDFGEMTKQEILDWKNND